MDAIQKISVPYELREDQIEFFRKNNFIKLKNVLSQDVLDYYGQAITNLVLEKSQDQQPLHERGTYGKAFLQVGQLWTLDETVKAFVMSLRLGKIAADLLEVSGVRLYHDQALYKEASGGFTPWHVDQHYWPLATDRTITAWIPLQATPIEMGPLEFAAGSQEMDLGRNLAISDESEEIIAERLKLTDFPVVREPFDLGEVSFHSGWVFHRAGPNIFGEPRKVMTIIYMDENMRLAEPKTKYHENDRLRFIPDIEVGDICASPLNPVIYSRG